MGSGGIQAGRPILQRDTTKTLVRVENIEPTMCRMQNKQITHRRGQGGAATK